MRSLAGELQQFEASLLFFSLSCARFTHEANQTNAHSTLQAGGPKIEGLWKSKICQYIGTSPEERMRENLSFAAGAILELPWRASPIKFNSSDDVITWQSILRIPPRAQAEAKRIYRRLGVDRRFLLIS